jgi:chorismate--pyruvate lyase
MLDFEGQSVIREVQLLGNHQVVVFARSVIPVTGDTQAILKIGSKPLGEILFNDPDIKRGQLQITHTGSTWGRRSTFTIGTTKLLVSEFFLECLYA